jgi:hypothetical protein
MVVNIKKITKNCSFLSKPEPQQNVYRAVASWEFLNRGRGKTRFSRNKYFTFTST